MMRLNVIDDNIPKRVTVPTFEIVSNPTITISQIKELRFRLDPLPCDLDWEYDDSESF